MNIDGYLFLLDQAAPVQLEQAARLEAQVSQEQPVIPPLKLNLQKKNALQSFCLQTSSFQNPVVPCS